MFLLHMYQGQILFTHQNGSGLSAHARNNRCTQRQLMACSHMYILFNTIFNTIFCSLFASPQHAPTRTRINRASFFAVTIAPFASVEYAYSIMTDILEMQAITLSYFIHRGFVHSVKVPYRVQGVPCILHLRDPRLSSPFLR